MAERLEAGERVGLSIRGEGEDLAAAEEVPQRRAAQLTVQAHTLAQAERGDLALQPAGVAPRGPRADGVEREVEPAARRRLRERGNQARQPLVRLDGGGVQDAQRTRLGGARVGERVVDAGRDVVATGSGDQRRHGAADQRVDVGARPRADRDRAVDGAEVAALDRGFERPRTARSAGRCAGCEPARSRIGAPPRARGENRRVDQLVLEDDVVARHRRRARPMRRRAPPRTADDAAERSCSTTARA